MSYVDKNIRNALADAADAEKPRCAFCRGPSDLRLCRACDVPETLAFEAAARASERAKVAEEIAKAIEALPYASDHRICTAIARRHAKRGES